MEIKKKQLSNILISSYDAQEVMKSQIKDDSLDRINLYFPDPWPKKDITNEELFRQSS